MTNDAAERLPFGTPAEKLHDQLAHSLNRGVRIGIINDTLAAERRAAVEPFRRLVIEGMLPWEQFGPGKQDMRLRAKYREALNVAREHLAILDAEAEPTVHMRQSLNGCVTCPRKWSDHTPIERQVR